MNRIAWMSKAETTNDNELTTKTVFRPKAAATTRQVPIRAPDPTLQVTEDSALATIDSSGPEVMFGITALRPGSNKAQKRVSRKSRT